MEQDQIEGMKHMQLTTEEEVQISVPGEGRSELLEECLLSLMGRLLTDRKQNQRALKNTLRLAWKVGPDLRIVEVWGLPFDMMSEKTRKDIGNSIGKFVMEDSRSWSSDQAKYMRIRVKIPLNKSLRQCGAVASPKGVVHQIFFRYERLPIFCFLCGIFGHDDRHCQSGVINTDESQQYGEWLRAQGGNKGAA
nr:hypothetical protein CFP56_67277 [Quercus suber]